VPWREPLHTQRRVHREHAILDRRVEAHHERPQRVVERLRCQLARLHLIGKLGDEPTDRVKRQLAERPFAERGE
jgi:hypothetical protein